MSCAGASSIMRYQMELIEPLWPRFGRMWTDEAERLRDRLGRCQDLEVLERLAGAASAAGALALAADPAHAPSAGRSSRIAPPASPGACSPSGRRRSVTGSKRCGSTRSELAAARSRAAGMKRPVPRRRGR